MHKYYVNPLHYVLFSPIQLGVGVPGGREAAVHAARRYAEDMSDDHVIVKLDF